MPGDLLDFKTITHLLALTPMTSLVVHVLTVVIGVIVTIVHVGIASVALHVALLVLERIDSVPLLLSKRSLSL